MNSRNGGRLPARGSESEQALKDSLSALWYTISRGLCRPLHGEEDARSEAGETSIDFQVGPRGESERLETDDEDREHIKLQSEDGKGKPVSNETDGKVCEKASIEDGAANEPESAKESSDKDDITTPRLADVELAKQCLELITSIEGLASARETSEGDFMAWAQGFDVEASFFTDELIEALCEALPESVSIAFPRVRRIQTLKPTTLPTESSKGDSPAGGDTTFTTNSKGEPESPSDSNISDTESFEKCEAPGMDEESTA